MCNEPTFPRGPMVWGFVRPHIQWRVASASPWWHLMLFWDAPRGLSSPHLICLTENHLKDYELNNTYIPKYKLGTNYWRRNLKQGGVCIYVCETLKFTNINLLKYSKEHDIEITAIQLNIQKEKLIIVCIYKAPCGNFDRFLNKLEIILNSLYKHNSEFITCGDININYLEPSNKKNQLDNLLGTYNLIDTVSFPTRIVNNTATLIDNIFIDNRRSYTTKPCLNGLSDHDSQILTLFKKYKIYDSSTKALQWKWICKTWYV
jgi:exonuclease III